MPKVPPSQPMPVDLTRHIAPDTGNAGKTSATKHTFRIDPSLISGVKPSSNVSTNANNKPEASEDKQKSATQSVSVEESANDAVAKKIEAVEKRIAQLKDNDNSTQVVIRRDSSSSIGIVERKPMLSFESSSVRSESPKRCEPVPSQAILKSTSVVHPAQDNTKKQSAVVSSVVDTNSPGSGKRKGSTGNQEGNGGNPAKDAEKRISSRQNSEVKSNNDNNNSGNNNNSNCMNNDSTTSGNKTGIAVSTDVGKVTTAAPTVEKPSTVPVPEKPQAPVQVKPQAPVQAKPPTEGIVEEQIDVSSVIKRFNDKCDSLKQNNNTESSKVNNVKQNMYATMDCRGKRNNAMNRGYTISEYSARAETFRRQASMQAQHCAHCKPGGHCKVRSRSQGATDEDVILTESALKNTVVNFRVRFDESSFRASDVKSHHHHHHHHNHHQKRRPASAASSDHEEDLFEKYETLV